MVDQFSLIIDFFINRLKNIQGLLETKGLYNMLQDIQMPSVIKNSILNAIGDGTGIQEIQAGLQENFSKIIGTGSEIIGKILGVGVDFASFVAKTAIVLTLSVLFSIQKRSVVKFIASLWWKWKREYLKIKLERIYKKLGLWVKWQLLLCLFIGLTMLFSLLIMSTFGLEIPQIWSLALIAGLTELIPYLWPTLWGLPAVLVVFLHNGFYAGLIMIGVIILIQRLENNVLIPFVMNKTLGINPVTIFLSIILGGLVMWFVGVLLAVPIAVVITLFFDDKFED